MVIKCCFLLAASLIASHAAIAQAHFDPAPAAIVEIEGGHLQGSEPSPGIRAYLGIPYAKPPVGTLRWQPPQPFGKWDGVRTGLAHGNPCPQQKAGWNNAFADRASEDCLYLNVWSPTSGTKLPVMVYIHGGSNIAGSAAEELSNGFALVPRGILLVTIDYRLGIFGFLRTPELDAESSHHASGNYGLLDQIAALQWVHKNIAEFGGDPANVTIFGQSAGAVDTGLLMVSPLARGLFAKAIEQSGQVVGLMPTATKAQSETAWAPVAKAIGPDLAAMRSASTAAIMQADKNAAKPPPEIFWGYRGASIDGWVLRELPATTFAQGNEAPVPLIIGSNVQEIVPSKPSPDWTHHLIQSALDPAKAARLEAIYAQSPANPLEGDPGQRFQTDRDFRCPVLQVATWHAAHGFPTYVYQFDRSPGSAKAALHSSELGFVFGYFPAHQQSSDDDTISSDIQNYWTDFARTNKPEVTGIAPWPRFSAASGAYLHIEANTSKIAAGSHLGGAACTILTGSDLIGSH